MSIVFKGIVLDIKEVAVIGTGAMGQGIAQIAAQAGLKVYLYDAQPEATERALAQLDKIWARQVERERMTQEQVDAARAQLVTIADLNELSSVDLVVEAIVENLDIKKELFAQLEGIVREECILASNTSSLSITAIAQACKHQGRVAGYHFFNPVPLMRVVEVIDGLRTRPEVSEALMALAEKMGHKAVRAKDMPGFIVNHAGRGMNTEGLRVAQEGVADFAQIDAIMREQAGFRMGPFELMDLTGLDVSHAVMESIYYQFYEEDRFRPSAMAAVRSAGGLYGRKTGEGFYRYEDGQKETIAEPAVPADQSDLKVWVAPYHEIGYERALACVRALGAEVVEGDEPPADALIVVTPFGEDVATIVSEYELDPERTVALDTLFGLEQGRRRVIMCSLRTEPKWRDAAHALFARDGTAVSVIADSTGFVAQRIMAMIVNIAADIAQQGIATAKDINIATALGLGYPEGGPLAYGDKLDAALILEILLSIQMITGDQRYRPSLWLQRRVQLGLPLDHENN